MHLCGMDYKYFSSHCCKCNSFGCITAIRCGNAYRGPHSDSLYSGREHNSPRLVKCEAGFPNPRRVLIGSNQLWRVNDSPYYRELWSYWMQQSLELYPNHPQNWLVSGYGLLIFLISNSRYATHLKIRGPLLTWLNINPSRISNHIHYTV